MVVATRPLAQIENPIINAPFDVPTSHYHLRDKPVADEIVAGQRPGGYFIPVPVSPDRTDTLLPAELDMFDEGRQRIELNHFVDHAYFEVDESRRLSYPGVAATTRSLLEHLANLQSELRFVPRQIEPAQ